MYAVFRAQQLAINKEVLLQMEEVEFMEKVLDSLAGVKGILRELRVGKIKSYIGSICSKSKKGYSKKEIKIMGEHSNDFNSIGRPSKLGMLKNRRKFKSDQRLFYGGEGQDGKEVGDQSKVSLKSEKVGVREDKEKSHLERMKEKLDDYFDSQKKKRLPKSKDYFSINKKLAYRRNARLSYENDVHKNYTIAEPGRERLSTGVHKMQNVGFYNAGNPKMQSSISISPIHTHKTPVAAALRRKLRSNKRLFNNGGNREPQYKSIKKSLDLDMLSQHRPLTSMQYGLDTSRSKLEVMESPIFPNSNGFQTSRGGNDRIEFGDDGISQSFYVPRGGYKPNNSTRMQYRPNMEDISLDDLEVVFEEKNKMKDQKLMLKSNKIKSVRNLDRFLKIGKISTPDFVCRDENPSGPVGFLSMTATDFEKNNKNFSGYGFRVDKSFIKGKKKTGFRDNVDSEFFKKLKKFNPLHKKTKKKKSRKSKNMSGRRDMY